MPTVNEELFDAANRHQVFLIRFGGQTAKKIVKLLEKADADLIARIAVRIERLGPIDRQVTGQGLLATKRLQSLQREIRKLNAELRTAIRMALQRELRDLAAFEVDLADRRLQEALGIDLQNFRPAPELLNAAVTAEPMRGRLLREWVEDLSRDRQREIIAAIQLGLVEGDPMPAIVRRVRDAGGVSQRRAAMLAQTSVNHIANRARELLYQANADIIKGLRWTATLDSRTSPICRARDGKTFSLNRGPRPPAHPNCRSVMTPITKTWDTLARNGALKPGRGGNNIRRVFERKLRKQGFSPEESAKIRRNRRASMQGDVPADLTFQDWLKRQPAGFQDDVLGKSKGRLFRKGKLTLDKFVDMRTGREFTLDELRVREAQAFMKAGLDETS